MVVVQYAPSSNAHLHLGGSTEGVRVSPRRISCHDGMNARGF